MRRHFVFVARTPIGSGKQLGLLRACRLSELDQARVETFKSLFDSILLDRPDVDGPDPDPILWQLTCIVDGDGYQPIVVGIGTWAWSLWALHDLRYSRFRRLEVVSFENAVLAPFSK